MQWLKVILTSKRAQAAIVGAIIAIAAKYGIVLDPETATQLVAVIVAWIVGESMRPAIVSPKP